MRTTIVRVIDRYDGIGVTYVFESTEDMHDFLRGVDERTHDVDILEQSAITRRCPPMESLLEACREEDVDVVF